MTTHEPAPAAPTRKPAPARVALECLECHRRWKVSPKAHDPQCPRCGGVDWDVLS